MSTVLPVIVGSTGRISKALIDHYVNVKPYVFACARDTCSVLSGQPAAHYPSLDEALNSLSLQDYQFQLVFSFRSRRFQSIDRSIATVVNSLDAVSSYSSVQPSIVFINSICSIYNESTQNIFYHLEKSTMSRLSGWFSSDLRFSSSIDILLHVVPREPVALSEYTFKLASLIDLSATACLNGSMIHFKCLGLHSFTR